MVERAPVQGFNPYFWIKTSEEGNIALCLEGIMRYKNFDPNAEDQLFSFVPVTQNQVLGQSCVVVNNNSGKALDIPGGTKKKGTRINQWATNRRFNQRWQFVQRGSGFLMVNLLTSLCIDIEGESTESGASVCQWEILGGTNQLWRPEQVGNGVYKIRSMHADNMYLSIKKQSYDDGGKLEIND